VTAATIDALAYFPYTPRLHQDRAVNLAVKHSHPRQLVS